MTMKMTARGLKGAQQELDDLFSRELPNANNQFLTTVLMAISANTAPYVPVDTSALINSEFRSIKETPEGLEAEIGYSQDYAEEVHDGKQKRWQKPGASNKFLVKDVRDFVRDDLAGLIARFKL